MPEGRSTEPLVWIDCEMTGLDYGNDTIMSIACFITNADLRLLDDKGFGATVLHSQGQLDAMGEWCKTTHGNSGLTDTCLNASLSVTAEKVATDLLAYVQEHVPDGGRGVLAGNSVHCDRNFLAKEPFKRVLDHLHYRILDVSAIKEAARRWAPVAVLTAIPKKHLRHEARADVLESIEEARYYKAVFFEGREM